MLSATNYIQLWSGGKDSTCSIVIENQHRDELGIPPSTIVMSEVMFDKKKGISAEFPDHMEWVHTKAKPLFESWGHQVIIKQSEKDYLDCFYQTLQRSKMHPELLGKHQGFPLGGTCIVQRDCKTKTVNKIRKEFLSDPNAAEFIGIAYDEPKRHGQLNERKRSLLCEYGVLEYQTYDIIRPYGLVSPIYTHTRRGGCWFCPNQSYEQLAWLKQNYPEYWEMLRELSLAENTLARGFKWGIPFDEVDRKVDNYLNIPKQLSLFDF